MRVSEAVAGAAFVYFLVVPWLRPVRATRRIQISLMAVAMLAFVALSRHLPIMVRDIAPLLSIGAGYYMSGLTFIAPDEALERWLMAGDVRLLGDPTTAFAHWPAVLLAWLDLIYTVTFVLLPSGVVALYLVGRTDLVDRYWTIVTACELGAFTPLAFIQTRPPWALERKPDLPDGAVHRLADHAVRNMTIGFNTFPSGHTAGSLGIALALLPASGLVASAFFVIAVSIAMACVIGRYHYAIDVVAGVALTLVVWGVVLLSGF